MNTGDHHLLHQSCIPIFSVFPKQIKNDKKKLRIVSTKQNAENLPSSFKSNDRRRTLCISLLNFTQNLKSSKIGTQQFYCFVDVPVLKLKSHKYQFVVEISVISNGNQKLSVFIQLPHYYLQEINWILNKRRPRINATLESRKT